MPFIPTAAQIAGVGGAFVQLFDSTLGAPATSIDTGDNGIAQTANALQIVIFARTDQAAVRSASLIRFNNDSGANYSRWLNYSTGASGPLLGTYLAGTAYDAGCPGSTVDAGVFSSYTLIVPAYRQTAGLKAISGAGGWGGSTSTNPNVETGAGTWNSSAAITRITMVAGTGSNFLTGTRLTIYGLI